MPKVSGAGPLHFFPDNQFEIKKGVFKDRIVVKGAGDDCGVRIHSRISAWFYRLFGAKLEEIILDGEPKYINLSSLEKRATAQSATALKIRNLLSPKPQMKEEVIQPKLQMKEETKRHLVDETKLLAKNDDTYISYAFKKQLVEFKLITAVLIYKIVADDWQEIKKALEDFQALIGHMTKDNDEPELKKAIANEVYEIAEKMIKFGQNNEEFEGSNLFTRIASTVLNSYLACYSWPEGNMNKSVFDATVWANIDDNSYVVDNGFNGLAEIFKPVLKLLVAHGAKPSFEMLSTLKFQNTVALGNGTVGYVFSKKELVERLFTELKKEINAEK